MQKHPVIRITSIDNVLKRITEVYSEAAAQLFKLKIIVKPFLNTVFNGKRESSYEKYLLPIIKRKNLHVLTNALVTKVFYFQLYFCLCYFIFSVLIRDISLSDQF